MKLLLGVLAICLICCSPAWGKSEWPWGTTEQGWKPLSDWELTPSSVIIQVTEDALLLLEPKYEPMVREIAEIGPRPQTTGNPSKDQVAYDAWEEKWHKSLAQTKFQQLVDYDPVSKIGGLRFRWDSAFLEMRRWRLYELAGYKTLSISAIAQDGSRKQYSLLLAKPGN